MERILKDWVIHSSLYLAVGSALTGYAVLVLLDLPITLPPLLIIFFGTFGVYNFNRFTDIPEDSVNHPERTRFIRKHSMKLKLFALGSYFLAVLVALSINIELLMITLIPGFAVSIYGTGNMSGFSRVKSILLFKNLFVAVVTALGLFGAIYFSTSFQMDVRGWLIFGTLFFLTFLNTIFFDIRDIEGDRENQIKTLPVVLGEKQARMLIIDLCIGYVALLGLVVGFSTIPSKFSILPIAAFYLLLVVITESQLESKYFISLFGDGWLVVVGLLSLLSRLVT